jgi:hypothetical protein
VGVPSARVPSVGVPPVGVPSVSTTSKATSKRCSNTIWNHEHGGCQSRCCAFANPTMHNSRTPKPKRRKRCKPDHRWISEACDHVVHTHVPCKPRGMYHAPPEAGSNKNRGEALRISGKTASCAERRRRCKCQWLWQLRWRWRWQCRLWRG